MPSSKGKPTDPKLREEVKESEWIRTGLLHTKDLAADAFALEVQNETNKDGSGKGEWSAWKVRRVLLSPHR